MDNYYIEKIEELYNLIKAPISDDFKEVGIIKFKNCFGISGLIWENNNKLIYNDKTSGTVYTPIEICKYMIKNTVKEEDIVKNPFIKILDPACGAGNFIISVFYFLREVFNKNLQTINKRNNLNLKKEEIDSHIVKHMIYGFDIDKTALKLLVIELFEISKCISIENFEEKDFLIEKHKEGFDFIIGNPPYIGHKTIDREYSKLLKNEYKEIYKDKGDLSYCFFKKAYKSIRNSGKVSFITSRYFLESPSGEGLRSFIMENFKINRVIDFYGIRPFKGVGIDTAILFLSKESCDTYSLQVFKPIYNKGKSKKCFYESLFLEKGKNYKEFTVNIHDIEKEGWRLIEKQQKNIIDKIEEKSDLSLKDISRTYQGIITGCDKAFILDEERVKLYKIEENLLKPWIKSSHILSTGIEGEKRYIIYSDLIEDEDKFLGAINFIKNYKEKLLSRRECKKGLRKWYQLQWGRDSSVFEGEKIIFPYKASANRFVVDKGSYFSADVYSLKLKNEALINYKSLCLVLNSKIYEFYFKSFGKKLGDDLYEYYPSYINKLKVPSCSFTEEEQLYEYFKITDEEREIINASL